MVFWVVNILLPDHVGLPHVLDLAVHLVPLQTWVGRVGHTEALRYPCDYSVTPVPIGLWIFYFFPMRPIFGNLFVVRPSSHAAAPAPVIAKREKPGRSNSPT